MLARPDDRQRQAPTSAQIVEMIASAKPARLTRAENSVHAIRDRLASANAALRTSIAERAARPGGNGGDTAVVAAQAAVIAIEEELKPARDELGAARIDGVPAMHKALEPVLLLIASDLLAVAGMLERPQAALRAMGTALAHLGLADAFPRIGSGAIPTPDAMRDLAQRLHRGAAEGI